MGLVDELQQSAEQDDVLTVLRKVRRVSTKLGRNDITDWLRHEQNGYPDGGITVPEYRQIQTMFCYKTNGYIPAGCGFAKNGIELLHGFDGDYKISVGQPISDILNWIESIRSGNGIFQELPPKANSAIREVLKDNPPELLNRLTFMAKLDDSQIRAIPEHIKNKILDWACELETAGVTGEGHSFSREEKQTAKNVTFNIKNSEIGQLNDSGNNIQLHIQAPKQKTIWHYLFTFYGIIGITATIIACLVGWYIAHIGHGIWFLGL